MVVPVGEPIRLQITGADVIHAFGVPSLWFKLDAVPGRINETVLIIDEPGVYYGQCSELCGARHAYMPIAVEALPRAAVRRLGAARRAARRIDGKPQRRRRRAAAAPAAASPNPRSTGAARRRPPPPLPSRRRRRATPAAATA